MFIKIKIILQYLNFIQSDTDRKYKIAMTQMNEKIIDENLIKKPTQRLKILLF